MTKPALMIALGGHPGPEGAHDDAPESEDSLDVSDDEEAMGNDILDALKAKDGAAVFAAIRAAVHACKE